MIFQSLISLYDRLLKTDKVPPVGFSREGIGFAVTIDYDGNLVGNPEDLRRKTKSSYDFMLSITPYTNQVNVRSSGAKNMPNFLTDKAAYIFGMSGRDRTDVHHKSFISLINEVCGDSTDPGILAVKRFLEKWNPNESVNLPYWDEICGINGKWTAFKLQNDRSFIHERSEVKKLWENYIKKKKYHRGVSFTDGLVHNLQTQYAQFPFGSGASLVSFNMNAYESYNKKRGENAPISVEAEFKSATALKYLLRYENKRRCRIGDTVLLYWAERDSPAEGLFGATVSPDIGDEGEKNAVAVREFLNAVQKGRLPNEIAADGELKFYILGFSENKARLAVRFWYVSSVLEIMGKLSDHFKCLEMEKHWKTDIDYPGLWHLLKETERDAKDISPVMSGALMRSILTGYPYPLNLYQSVLNRIRADRRINYLRASILKAVLQRNYKKEVSMSLDLKRREPAYLLGRLFAVLEKAQGDALGKGVNTNIKDRFFGAASTTPASVFPRLMQLTQHHMKKAEYGYTSDKRISGIMEHLDHFPAQLGLQEQGVFSIAYYHQKNAIYAKNAHSEGEKNG